MQVDLFEYTANAYVYSQKMSAANSITLPVGTGTLLPGHNYAYFGYADVLSTASSGSFSMVMTIPEPASLATMTLGGLLLLRRKR